MKRKIATRPEWREWIKVSFTPIIFAVARGMGDEVRASLLANDNTTIVEELKHLK